MASTRKFEVFVMTRVFVEVPARVPVSTVESTAIIGVGLAGSEQTMVPVIDQKVVHLRALADDATPESLV